MATVAPEPTFAPRVASSSSTGLAAEEAASNPGAAPATAVKKYGREDAAPSAGPFERPANFEAAAWLTTSDEPSQIGTVRLRPTRLEWAADGEAQAARILELRHVYDAHLGRGKAQDKVQLVMYDDEKHILKLSDATGSAKESASALRDAIKERLNAIPERRLTAFDDELVKALERGDDDEALVPIRLLRSEW